MPVAPAEPAAATAAAEPASPAAGEPGDTMSRLDLSVSVAALSRGVGGGEEYVAPDFNAGYLSNPKPEYPALSRRLREQGLVKLRVHVAEDGRPDEVTLNESCGFDRLDRAAMDAVKRWRFKPAQRAGMPVAAWVVVPLRFKLEG